MTTDPDDRVIIAADADNTHDAVMEMHAKRFGQQIEMAEVSAIILARSA